jgi:hypothetical protein
MPFLISAGLPFSFPTIRLTRSLNLPPSSDFVNQKTKMPAARNTRTHPTGSSLIQHHL